ncbi:MAG: sulfotransferase family protein [Hyphomicrobiaceae bacterium]
MTLGFWNMGWQSRRRSIAPASAFICGCGHSGTSIITAILAAHPEIYVPLRETGIFLGTKRQAKNDFKKLTAESIGSGRQFIVEKTPRHIHHLDLIREIVKDAKFIMPVRDGRDVATSIEKRTGDLTQGQERWILDNSIVSREKNNRDVIVYRYECFIDDPSPILRQICEFIGVAYTPQILNYHETERLWFGQSEIENRDAVGEGHEAHRNWQINQKIFDGRGKWKSVHTEEDFGLLNEGAGKSLMKEFCYIND